jgi:hypothetical protein
MDPTGNVKGPTCFICCTTSKKKKILWIQQQQATSRGKLCFTCFTKYKKVEVTTGYSVYCFTCRCSSGSSRQRGGPKSRGEGRCQRPRGCWSRQSGATPAAPHTNTHSSQGSCASSGSFVVVKAFKGLLQLVSGWGLGFRIRFFRSRYRSQVTVVVGA